MSRIIHAPVLLSLLVVGFSFLGLAQPSTDNPPSGQELNKNRMLIAFNLAGRSLKPEGASR